MNEKEAIETACSMDDMMCGRWRHIGDELLLPIKEIIDYEGIAKAVLKTYDL